MRRSIALFVAMSAALSLTVPAFAQSTPAAASSLQSALNARVAGTNVGIAVGIIDHGRASMLFAGTSGNGRPLDAHTLFEIGSVTKTFTATALASMVLAGRVKLGDPVAKYLPKSVHVPQRGGYRITLLNLAEQRSGLPRMPTNMKDETGPDPYAAYGRSAMYAFLNAYTLTRNPGASYLYSNYGIGLLGQALANAAGMPYTSLVAQRVLDPLDMSDTTFATMPASDPPTLAVGHDFGDKPVHAWHFRSILPAGGIRSSLSDMMKYLRCNMGQGPLANVCLFAQKPRAAEDAEHRIGLVWNTNTSSGVISHGGDTEGFHTFIAISRDRQTGVVVLSNGAFVSDIAAHVLVPSYPIAGCPDHVATSDTDPASYSGVYCNAVTGMTFTVKALHGGGLSIALLPQPAYAYARIDTDTYRLAVADATFVFVRKEGNIVGLRLIQSGQVIPAFRLGADGKPVVAMLPSAFPATVLLAPSVLEQYVGSYDSAGATFTVTLRGEQLYVQLTGQSAVRIYASAKDRFFLKIVDAQIDFNRDASGRVTSLTLHQNGRDITAARSKP